MPQPSIGRIVHYNQDGDCRAAIITQTDGQTAAVTVFHPWGPSAMPGPIEEGSGPGT